MYKFYLCFIYFLCFVDPGLTQNSNFVSTKGKEIITPDGKPLILRGINTGNWLVPEGYMFKFDSATSPRLINKVISELVGPDDALEFWKKFRDNYITKEDIKFIKASGLNSIRIPFNWKLFVSEENPDIFTGPGFEMLDRAIRWCRECNLYAILDMHCAPGGQTGDNIDDGWGFPFLFLSEKYQDITAGLWKKIAERYKDETIIIGYDLLNEPIAHFYDSSFFNPKLEPLYKKITKEIREVDKNHLIFLGGSQWNTNFNCFGKPFDNKLVYTFHVYWTDITQSVIQRFIDFREKYNVPIWLGESGENKNTWINSFRQLLEKNNIGWCFWPYKKLSAQSCMITFEKPELYDKIIRFANSPRATFRELREIRIPYTESKIILNNFLENCKFNNCKINKGYLEALGL